MERRLIFFSGGVESTALLTLSTPDDIIVTIIDPPYQQYNWFSDVDKKKVLKIAKYFNRHIHFNPMHVPAMEIEKGVGVHQINHIYEIANHWARIKSESLKEVWDGQTDEEYALNWPNRKLRDDWNKCFEILHPNIKFHNPLGHLTKRESWNLIPDEIKPLINYCREFNRPGGPGQPDCECQKCIRHKQMLNGGYDGPWKRIVDDEGKMWLVDPTDKEQKYKYSIKG